MKPLPLALIILLAPALLAAPPRERKVDKRALETLERADKLVYRPVEHGLRDISFTFDVMTREGKLTCLFLFRAASGEVPSREKWTIRNIEDKSKRRRFAAGLREYHDIAVYPLFARSFLEPGTEQMDVNWLDSARGGCTVLEHPKPPIGKEPERKPGLDRIGFLWNSDGLPMEIVRSVWQDDPDEGIYRIEYSASYEWKQYGKYWAIALVNSDFTGFRILAKYEYKEVKGILLPSAITRINPMEGEDLLTVNDLRVNEGISDEEFARW
ncbi:MAG: hypothetical protein MUE73_13205 [Planctomycetes bacterium]|jgi:hypothetical protein|nr:hypothetical protein [Planctomycetota bacterium]